MIDPPIKEFRDWARKAKTGDRFELTHYLQIRAAHYLQDLGLIFTFNKNNRSYAQRISPLAARFIGACSKGQFHA